MPTVTSLQLLSQFPLPPQSKGLWQEGSEAVPSIMLVYINEIHTQCNPAMESALQKEVIAGCHEQSSSGNWFIYLEAVVAISAQTE